MGEVVEVGTENGLKPGDRVVVPFAIACGRCFFCQHGLTSLCDNSNPSASCLEKKDGYSSSGLFGYSHMYGGYAGGQAEYGACLLEILVLFEFPIRLRMNKCFFSRIFCRPSRLLRTVTSSRAIPSLFGVVAPSASLPFEVHSCWELNA